VKPYVVLITPSADAPALAADRSWRAIRPAAPDLFSAEFARVRDLLATATLAFPLVMPVRRRRRRLLLPRSKFHVYYRSFPKRRLVVVEAVWSAVRGRGPRRSRT
jgi:hypothetical protein